MWHRIVLFVPRMRRPDRDLSVGADLPLPLYHLSQLYIHINIGSLYTQHPPLPLLN